MIPGRTYDRVLRRGLQGYSVFALQLNLEAAGFSPGELDGDFGPATLKAVVALQKAGGLTQDGIAGLLTQRKLCIRLDRDARREYDLPPGLSHGIVEGETSWAVACVSAHENSGDFGWTQQNLPWNLAPAEYRKAFHGPTALGKLAERLRRKKNEYYGDPGAKTHKRAWELAVLFWNWQSAADRYANGSIDTWRYMDRDGSMILMSEPALWIKDIGVPGVETGHEWASHYIDSKTLYCDWSQEHP